MFHAGDGNANYGTQPQGHQGLEFREIRQNTSQLPANYQPPPPPTTTKPPPPPPQVVHNFPPLQVQDGHQYHVMPPQVGHHFPPLQVQYHAMRMPMAMPMPQQQQQQQQQQWTNSPIMHMPQQNHAMPPMPMPMPMPQQQQQQQQHPGVIANSPIMTNQAWKSNLFDCMKNPTNALITFLFPCVTFGLIAEILDEGRTSCATGAITYACFMVIIGPPCLRSCRYRSKLRAKFGLAGSPCSDCLIHCCCENCALCQEYRELQERGFDPSIGHEGNMAKQQRQQQQFGFTPPMQQRMMM